MNFIVAIYTGISHLIHTLVIMIHYGLPVERQLDEETQELLCSSITVLPGHWQPLMTQTAGQITVVFTSAHVMLHAEAQSIRT